VKLSEYLVEAFKGFDAASHMRKSTTYITRRWSQIKHYWSTEWNAVSHGRLYVASFVATGVLLGSSYSAIAHIQNAQTWNKVFSNGTYIGLVPDNGKVLSTMNQIAKAYDVQLSFVTIHTHVAGDYNWTYVESLPTTAVAIRLNGQPLLYTSDESSAQKVISSVKAALLPKNITQSTRAHFVGDVTTSPVMVSVTKILSPESAIRLILHPDPTSMAGRGQTLSGLSAVAEQKQTGASQVQSSEQGTQSLLQVAVEKTVTETKSVPFPIHYIKDNYMGVGKISVVRPGQQGLEKEQVQLSYVDGQLQSQKVLSHSMITKPTPEIAKQGINAGIAVGHWGWPSPSYTITSPYGWRILFGRPNFHPGIDIGCPIGTPVYATNNGVVMEAGWNNGGYGNWVRINNGHGLETIFGHLSKVLVHAGETVAKGQEIGLSGDTGFSTGPHLHYEVRLYGHHINPSPYM
jgi:murein DD-endopeptidase MepM/ murein hydrolase activator NlpD